jgi:hypothetical protein
VVKLVPFPYYARLSPRKQAIYRQSDRIVEIRLPHPDRLHAPVAALRQALEEDRRRAVEAAAAALCSALLAQLELAPIRVQVLAVRPHNRSGELHGLYTYGEADPPSIRVWMRTAQHRRVVAFRAFLRTLIHEVCHHLDYRYLKLKDSYHTEGFFRRESSVFRQIVPGTSDERVGSATPRPPSRAPAKTTPSTPTRRRNSPKKVEPDDPQTDAQGRLPFD